MGQHRNTLIEPVWLNVLKHQGQEARERNSPLRVDEQMALAEKRAIVGQPAPKELSVHSATTRELIRSGTRRSSRPEAGKLPGEAPSTKPQVQVCQRWAEWDNARSHLHCVAFRTANFANAAALSRLSRARGENFCSDALSYLMQVCHSCSIQPRASDRTTKFSCCWTLTVSDLEPQQLRYDLLSSTLL